MKRTWYVAGAALIAAGLIALVAAFVEDGKMPVAERKDNERRVEVVAAALEDYLAQAGRYPNALSELVPHHLAEESLSDTRGGSYEYYLHNTLDSEAADEGYILRFSVGGGVICSYGQIASAVFGWDCSRSVE